MKKIIKAFALVTVLSLVTRGLSFIYRIIISRYLTSVELGLYQSAIGVFMVLITLTSSGLPLAVSRLTAEKSDSLKSSDKTLTSAIVIGAAFSLILTAAVILCKPFLQSLFAEKSCYDFLKSLLPALIASSFYSAFRGSLWGRGKFFLFSLSELIEEIVSLLTVIILFALCNSPQKLFFISAAISASYIIAAVFSFSAYIKCGGGFKLNKCAFKETASVAVPITSVRLLSSLASAFITLILPKRLILSGLDLNGALSLIGLVTGIVLPLLFAPSSIVGSLCLVLVPNLAKDFNSGIDIKDQLKKSFTFAAVLSGVALSIYLSLSEEICGGVFLKVNAAPYLKFAALAMLPMSLNQISASSLNSVGGERNGLINFCIGGATSVIIVIFLTPVISVYAMLSTMFIQPTIVFVLNILKLSKITRISPKYYFSSVSAAFIALPFYTLGIIAKNTVFAQGDLVKIFFVGAISLIYLILLYFTLFREKTKSAIKC